MDCLQLHCIRVWQTNLKGNVCRNSTFQVNRKKNDTGRRRLTLSNRAAIFVSSSCEERYNEPFWLETWRVNRKQQIKLYFSSLARKQFKLLAVPSKPFRCCLRNDKLVNCHVWKFCKDLFLNLRVIWSINQIVLFNGFLSDFVEFTSSISLKQLFFSVSVNNNNDLTLIYIARIYMCWSIALYNYMFKRKRKYITVRIK